jgi:hypothetical protein
LPLAAHPGEQHPESTGTCRSGHRFEENVDRRFVAVHRRIVGNFGSQQHPAALNAQVVAAGGNGHQTWCDRLAPLRFTHL